METEVSPAAKLAWQTGAMFAIRAGAPEIAPIHLLYGVVSLLAIEPGSSEYLSVKEEADEVSSLLHRASVSGEQVRRKVEEGAPPAAETSRRQQLPLSRSRETKAIFGNAGGIGKSVHAVGLVRALAASDDQSLSCVATELKAIHSAARGLSSDSVVEFEPLASPVEIEHSIDANALISTIPGKKSDTRWSSLADLARAFESPKRTEAVLESALAQVLQIFPAAESAAVLTKCASTSNLLLKAHVPTGIPRVSLSCAMRALEEQRAFIWRSGEGATRSQLVSKIGSGIYVPLIANESAVGILGITSTEQDSFSCEDLYIAAAVGHQLSMFLRNRELQTQLAFKATVLERLLTNFSPQMRKNLVERAESGRLQLGGQRSEVTVLCSDIRGFTTLAAKMDADDVVQMLNDYFRELTECIFRHGGIVDKFVGDAILAVFGSPEPDQQHRQNAARAALDMQRVMKEVNVQRQAKREVTCTIGIGVHCGEVVHGFIGTKDRMEFTVIGDAVNWTARLCDGAGAGEVLVSSAIYEHLWRSISAEPVSIETKHEGTLSAYRLHGMEN